MIQETQRIQSGHNVQRRLKCRNRRFGLLTGKPANISVASIVTSRTKTPQRNNSTKTTLADRNQRSKASVPNSTRLISGPEKSTVPTMCGTRVVSPMVIHMSAFHEAFPFDDSPDSAIRILPTQLTMSVDLRHQHKTSH